MSSFESDRPRTSRAHARLRERQLKESLEKLLDVGDEETFKRKLAEDFGIKPDHPRFGEMLRIWRGSQPPDRRVR
jgi:hypothetical protein